MRHKLCLVQGAAIAGGACVWVGGMRLRRTADTFLVRAASQKPPPPPQRPTSRVVKLDS